MALARTLDNLATAARAAWSSGTATRGPRPGGPVDLLLCIADHFEPHVGAPPPPVARTRTEDWLCRYPEVAARHRDSDGRPPAHTFFYPWDEYDPWEMTRLAELCSEGWGEVEIHLHHRDDTSESLARKLRQAIAEYRSHGALPTDGAGRAAFGFVHGNWALDNSRIENGRNFCGVDNEIDVLLDEGCYADFTFPAWKQPSQPRLTNRIYWAIDDPTRPKSHDRGVVAAKGGAAEGLLIAQGPLVPFLARRYGGPRIAMDDGDLAASRPYAPSRLDRWVRAGIGVAGRPDRVFVKLHCHGAADANRELLLGRDLEALFRDAEQRYNDGEHYRLHYVTAREMANVVRATIADDDGTIDRARDWLLPPPAAI